MNNKETNAKYPKGLLSGVLIIAFLFTGVLFPSYFILFFLLSLLIGLWNIRRIISPKEETLSYGKEQQKENGEKEEPKEKKLIVDLSSKDLEKENELKNRKENGSY